MKLTGAQIVIECLKEQGVDTVFGYPGGTIINIYDELYKHSQEIRHYLTAHEQGASHAADGYARATGKVGVVMATSGPGSTNLVTGLATAFMDSTPMVAITANVPMNLIGKDSFQEIDIFGITMPITKHNFLVKDIKDLAGILREAFHIARSGRPGPVLVDIPKDLTSAVTEYTYEAPREAHREKATLEPADLKEAMDLLRQAKKPFILVGGGAALSQADAEVVEFAHKINAPVTCSLMGTGVFPGEDPLYTGMIGMHGSKSSNIGITRCDLLVVIGARLNDRVIGSAGNFAGRADILHIDIDPAEINKNVASDHFLIGDIKEVLRGLNADLEQMDHSAWIDEVNGLIHQFPLEVGEGLTGQFVIEKLYELTGGDAIVCTEVGQHQMWASQYYRFKSSRQLLTSGGLGTMGFGMGAALGAKLAFPDRTVLNIAGDGCFRMNLNELITAVRYNIPIVVVVLNNKVLGMVRQWQTLFYDERYSATDLGIDIDYVKLCEAFGAVGFNLDRKEDADRVLKEALATGRPTVINCIIDKNFKVLPMVPPGKGIDELIMD